MVPTWGLVLAYMLLVSVMVLSRLLANADQFGAGVVAGEGRSSHDLLRPPLGISACSRAEDKEVMLLKNTQLQLTADKLIEFR